MKKKTKDKRVFAFFARRESLTKFAAVFVAFPLFLGSASSIISQFDSSVINLFESLDFWLAYMAYMVAAFLGMATLINGFIERKLQQENEAANTKCPYLEISSTTTAEGKSADFYGNHYIASTTNSVVIVIRNWGEGPANEITATCDSAKIEFGCLRAGDELRIPICAKPENAGKRICTDIHYKNILGYPYLQKLEYILVPKQIEVNDHLQEINYDLHVYNMGYQERLGEVTLDYKT